MNASPTPTGQSTTQGGQKKGNDVLGPLTHPKYPFLVFSCVLAPNQANQALPTFWFCLWEQGMASYYRYQAKKKDDKTIMVLWKSLSAPAGWIPSASEAPYVTALDVSVAPETSTSPTKPTAAKRVTIKLQRIEALPQNSEGLFNLPPGWPFPSDMTTAYLTRLNKLLLSVDKKLKMNSDYTDSIHMSTYVCLLESTRLAFHIWHDTTIDESQKATRLKMLNEWITRMLLTLDNINVPLIKDPNYVVQNSDSSDPDADGWIPDPMIRAKRKALVNLSLSIGSELASLISFLDPSSPSSSSSLPPQSPTSSTSTNMNLLWEDISSLSPVSSLLRAANPHQRT